MRPHSRRLRARAGPLVRDGRTFLSRTSNAAQTNRCGCGCDAEKRRALGIVMARFQFRSCRFGEVNLHDLIGWILLTQR